MSVTNEDVLKELQRRAQNGDAAAQRAIQQLSGGPAVADTGGVATNLAKGAGRGVTATLGIPGDVGAGLKDAAQMPTAFSGAASAVGKLLDYLPDTGQIRGGVDAAVDVLPGADPNASVFQGGEDTIAGRAGEFVGGAAAFGAPGVVKQGVQSGLKAAAAKIASRQTVKRGTQAAAAGVGSGVGEDLFGTPGALVGAFAPGAIFAGSKAALKVGLRGLGEKKSLAMAQRIDQQLKQGGTPTIGGVGGNKRTAALERLSESQPGAVSKWRTIGDKNAEGLQKRLADLLSSRGFSDVSAGNIVASSMKKTVQRIRLRSRQLYARAEKTIKRPDTLVIPKQTINRLKELSAQSQLGNKWDDVIASVKQVDDVAGDLLEQIYMTGNATSSVATRLTHVKVPFNALNELRKSIGMQISLRNFEPGDKIQGVLRQIYGSLSKDVQSGAHFAGGKTAATAFKNANSHWRAARSEMDTIISPILKREALPEEVFRNVVGTSLQHHTKLRVAMKGMDKQQREIFVKRFVSKLGKLDDETGAVKDVLWSPGRMLSNWERIDGSQMKRLFRGNESLKGALDDYFAVLKDQKSAAGVLANPSGTAGLGLGAMTMQQMIQNGIRMVAFPATAAAAGGAAAGPVGAIAAAGGAMGLNRGVAHLLTSEKFLRWVAKAPVDFKEAPKHLARLNIIAQTETDPETVEALNDFNTTLGVMFENQGVQ